MIVSTYRIPYRLGETIRIKPIFDVHLGNKYCDLRHLREYLDDPEAYFFGGGDFLDSIITRDVRRYEKHADATEGDAIIDEQVEQGFGLLRDVKDRIIGWGTGNHESAIKKHCGTDPAARMAQLLGCPYLGFSGLLRLQLSEGGARGRTVDIRWHHGWGGGSRTQGADLTKYAKDVAYWQADVFLYGHVHKRQADRVPRLALVGDKTAKLISRPQVIGLCGTFLKTYTTTADATYSEIAGYPPVEIGGLTVNIKPNQQWCDIWIS